MREAGDGELLAAVHRARFGDVPFEADNSAPLLMELRRFHKFKSKTDPRILSRTAVRNWFSPEKESQPTRRPAISFLLDYLEWAKRHDMIRDEAAYSDAVRHLEVCALELEDIDANEILPPKGWEGDSDTWKSALRLSGIYQVIRPSATRSNKKPAENELGQEDYVLECLLINPHAQPDRRILMYSHKARDKRFIYKGTLQKSTWSLFALIGRQNSNTSTRKSFRTLALCVEDNADCECLSGILSRSMSDDLGFGKRIMATPFVVIRCPDDAGDFDFAALAPTAHADLHRLGDGLLIGKVSSTKPCSERILEVCHSLFQELRDSLRLPEKSPAHESILTSVANNDEVHRAVGNALKTDRDFFNSWSQIGKEIPSRKDSIR